MYKLILISIFYFSSECLFAQKTGKVTGNISDKNVALEFVTVTLNNLADTGKVVYYTTTDSTGFFSLDKIDLGDYQLKFSLIGYKSATQKISLTADTKTIQFDHYNLDKDANFLQSVTVTSQKKLIEKTQQGFIVNAAANITSSGGTATDILKNTPTVSVDADGAITLRGKTPLILINGRNSNLGNPDQIPASSIESIEIINNPTAKYDANAESGIINIKLKKNKQNGTNGALALGAGFGSRGRINSSFLVNHKTKKWNLGLGYDNRFAGRTRKINASRTNYYLPDEYLLNQNRNDERLEQLQNLKFNVDFTPDNKNTFSLEAIGNMEGQDNDESLNSIIYKQNNDFNSNTNRHSLELERSKVAEFAFDYNRKFNDPQKSLSASITSSINRDRENTDITSQPLDENGVNAGDPFLQKTHNYENGNVSTAKLDYAFPFTSNGKIETGYKGVFRRTDDDFQTSALINGDYIVNTAASDIFKFNEQVNALYALYSSGFGSPQNQKWKYDLGIRAEQTSNDGNTQKDSTKFTNQYLDFFPTASLIYYNKPEAYWKLSYGKRINRPGMGQLNPFVDITDSLNPHSGNPNLQPEIIHAIELGYNKEWSRYAVSTNLFYRYSINTIRQYSHLQSNGANLTFPVNIGNATTFGIESILNAKLSGFYDFNASISLFQQKLNGSNISKDAVQEAFGWYAKLINNFVPWQGSKLQVTGNYNSALPTPQGKRIAQYFVDLGFQQKLGKGNARVGLTVTDIFNTFKSGYTNSTTEFTNYRYGKADTRAFIVTFAWFFKSAFKEKLLENKFSTEY
ncbi:TonB-dependent receptor domain-containing protein [Flavihumibacter profundi]|uniref:TonB-dependent receptor domain-containing protein n=1 Tax=Flavihumibacter profundi TaxID=2716883 RepID=UPI001CC3F5A2|nr:TonB-dependent receptor [Flavihumibacter profundi]MBZ5857685.1 TonB-dependent receptor [Flavihumibacter profundi]